MDDHELRRMTKQLEEINTHLKYIETETAESFLQSIDQTLSRIENTLDVIKEQVKRSR